MTGEIDGRREAPNMSRRTVSRDRVYTGVF